MREGEKTKKKGFRRHPHFYCREVQGDEMVTDLLTLIDLTRSTSLTYSVMYSTQPKIKAWCIGILSVDGRQSYAGNQAPRPFA